MNFLLQNVLISQDDGYHRVDLQVTDRQIQALQPATTPLTSQETTIDGGDRLLLPGFVNGHTHSSQMWQRGLIPPLPLELWLADVMDTAPTLVEHYYLGALSTAIETLLSGGTCVVDHSYLAKGYELETVAALAKAYKQVGMRAVIAPLIQDQPLANGFPSGSSLPFQATPQPTEELLALMEEIARTCHDPASGIYIAMGPTGFHRCSDRLLEGCTEISDRYQLCRHTHLLETRAQKMIAAERYGGLTAVQHLQKLGFLGDRTSLAHSVWISDADIEILAETGSTVVHNPVSNLRLGSGIAPILKCLQAGVNVGFGCDGAASNDSQHLLEAIKLGTILHTVTDPDYQNWLTPQKTLTMAALGGAKGIHLADQIGSIEVGKAADLVLYDLTHPCFLPNNDILTLLVLGRPTNVIDRVWINGKPIVEQGKVLTVDVEAFQQELRERGHLVDRSQFKTIHQLEGHYRKTVVGE